jgi:hypothetical protein
MMERIPAGVKSSGGEMRKSVEGCILAPVWLIHQHRSDFKNSF